MPTSDVLFRFCEFCGPNGNIVLVRMLLIKFGRTLIIVCCQGFDTTTLCKLTVEASC